MTRPQLATKKMSLPVHGGNDPSVAGGHTKHARSRSVIQWKKLSLLAHRKSWVP